MFTSSDKWEDTAMYIMLEKWQMELIMSNVKVALTVEPINQWKVIHHNQLSQSANTVALSLNTH